MHCFPRGKEVEAKMDQDCRSNDESKETPSKNKKARLTFRDLFGDSDDDDDSEDEDNLQFFACEEETFNVEEGKSNKLGLHNSDPPQPKGKELLQLVFDDEDGRFSEEDLCKEIQRDPSLAKEKYKFYCYGPCGIYGYELYPLWGAARRGFSYHTIQQLCDACPSPQAFQDTDVNRLTPLHVACLNPSPEQLDIVKLLCSRYTPALKAVGLYRYYGYTPLHLAIRHGASLGVIKWLVEQQESDILTQVTGVRWHVNDMVQPARGFTPFQLACRFGASLDVVQFLAAKHPESLQEKAVNGDTALHLACGMPHTPLQSTMADPVFNTQVQMDLVEYLARQNPKAMREPGNSGDTPIIVAQKQKAPDELIALLTSLDSKLNGADSTS